MPPIPRQQPQAITIWRERLNWCVQLNPVKVWIVLRHSSAVRIRPSQPSVRVTPPDAVAPFDIWADAPIGARAVRDAREPDAIWRSFTAGDDWRNGHGRERTEETTSIHGEILT